jgi:hypothetical protein
LSQSCNFKVVDKNPLESGKDRGTGCGPAPGIILVNGRIECDREAILGPVGSNVARAVLLKYQIVSVQDQLLGVRSVGAIVSGAAYKDIVASVVGKGTTVTASVII